MVEQMTLPALARTDDPDTSRAAAEAVTPALPEIERAILRAVEHYIEATAFTVAEHIGCITFRWDEGTIRTRVSNMGKRGLLVKCGEGKSPRGRRADLWRLPS